MLEGSSEEDEVIDLESFPIPAYFYVELLQQRIPDPNYQGISNKLSRRHKM